MYPRPFIVALSIGVVCIALWGRPCKGQVSGDSLLVGHYSGDLNGWVELVLKADHTFIYQAIVCLPIKWKGEWRLEGNQLVLKTLPRAANDRLTWEGASVKGDSIALVLDKVDSTLTLSYGLRWIKDGKPLEPS